MNKLINAFFIMLRGFLMGLADIIPGVSGGTIALITGIYDKLVFSISEINLNFILDFVRKDTRNMKKNLRRIDLWFFIPLGIGIGTAFLVFSGMIGYMLDSHTAITYSFFFGLILASSFFVYRKIKELSILTIVSSIVGFLFAFVLIGIGVIGMMGHSLFIIFLSGVIAICAMILPGISGAFLLLFLGQYKYLLNALHNIEITKIITFLIGAGIGILMFSRILNYLLRKYRAPTMAFLTGLMLGSLRLPFKEIVGASGSSVFISIAGLIGFLIVIVLENSFNKRKKNK